VRCIDSLDGEIVFGCLDDLSERQAGIAFVRVLWHLQEESDKLATTLAGNRRDWRFGSEKCLDPALRGQIGFGRAVTARVAWVGEVEAVGFTERRDSCFRTDLLENVGVVLGRDDRPCTRDGWQNCFRAAGRKRAR
jgi:hypothetical protein